MKRADIEYVLRELGAEKFQLSGDHVMTNCVLAPWTHAKGTDSRPSMGVKISPGMSVFNCFSCGSSGGFLKLVNMAGRYRVADGLMTEEELQALRDFVLMAEEETEGVIVKGIEGMDSGPEPLPKKLLDMLGRYHPYYEKRSREYGWPGIREDTAKLWNLGYGTVKEKTANGRITHVERLLLPVMDHEGEIVLVQGRVLRDDVKAPKYRNFPKNAKKSLYLYGEHLITDEIDTLIVIESQMGTVLANQLLRDRGENNVLVVGLMGSKPSNEQLDKLVRWGTKEVVLFMDNDPAGKVGMKQLVDGLRYRCNITVVSYPEGTDGADPDSVGPERFLQMLETRRSFLEDRLAKIFARN